MRTLKILLAISLALTFLSGCGSKETKGQHTATTASWAFEFVVWDGDAYAVSHEKKEIKKVGKEIGSVTQFSNKEGTYSDGFSNKFPVGTKLYELQGVDPKKSIAIGLQDGTYIKADNQGKYSENK